MAFPQLVCCLVAKSCPTICKPMDCSTPGFPVLYYLPEFAQTHVHRVSDAINHLNLCRPLLLLPSIFPSIRAFPMSQLFTSGSRSIRASASASFPSREYSGLIPFRIDWFELLERSKGLSRVFSSTTVRKHQFFSTQPSLWSSSHICT